MVLICEGLDLDGVPCLRMLSVVAEVGDDGLAPEAAVKLLSATTRLKLGNLAIQGRHLVLGLTLPASCPDAAMVACCRELARSADEAERSLTGGGDAY